MEIVVVLGLLAFLVIVVIVALSREKRDAGMVEQLNDPGAWTSSGRAKVVDPILQAMELEVAQLIAEAPPPPPQVDSLPEESMEELVNALNFSYPANASAKLMKEISARRSRAFEEHNANYLRDSEAFNAQLADLKAESEQLIESMKRGEISVEDCRVKLDVCFARIDEVRKRDADMRDAHLAHTLRKNAAARVEPVVLPAVSVATAPSIPTIPRPLAHQEQSAKPHFDNANSFVGKCAKKRGFAIDRASQHIALFNEQHREIVQFDQIISSELCVDSDTLVRTDRVGQIGGALVGGALTGGFGAIVMALGAKKKQIEHIRRIELKILTAHSKTPIHMVQFHPSPWGSAQDALKEATKWHDLLTVCIRESASPKQASSTATSATGNVVDQLTKLAEMHRDGFLSDAELQVAKARLL